MNKIMVCLVLNLAYIGNAWPTARLPSNDDYMRDKRKLLYGRAITLPELTSDIKLVPIPYNDGETDEQSRAAINAAKKEFITINQIYSPPVPPITITPTEKTHLLPLNKGK